MGFTAIPNDLFEAVLRYKCPGGQKEVIFAIMRLTLGYQRPAVSVSISSLAKFLGANKSHTGEYVRRLIEKNVLRVTTPPTFHTARALGINKNFSAWLQEPDGIKEPPAEKSVSSEHENHQVSPTDTVPVEGTQCVPDNGTIHRNTPYLKNTRPEIIEEEEVLNKESPVKDTDTPPLPPGNASPVELEIFIKSLFKTCLGYKSNRFERRAIRKQVCQDERFTRDENLKIVQDAFYKAAIVELPKRNTPYVLGIIRSMKMELLRQREKQKAAGQLHMQCQKEFIPWSETGFSLREDIEKLRQGITLNDSPN